MRWIQTKIQGQSVQRRNAMLYPMFAMVLLTFAVAVATLRVRGKAARAGTVDIGYFRLMQGQELPEAIVKSTRHFSNLFEMPMLFYVACTAYLALSIQSGFALFLAWLFVLFRCVHAWIHLGYNNVMHRLAAFMAANLCILLLWIILVFSY